MACRSYRFTFDPSRNLYYLQHSGTNAQFNTLPQSPFRQTDDPVDKQTTKLATLPLPEPGVRLVGVVQMQASPQSATTLEFTSLGGTTSNYSTVVWLACGGGTQQRFISVSADPVTGLVTIGPHVSAMPSTVATAVQSVSAQPGN